jgi:hypothetical protein
MRRPSPPLSVVRTHAAGRCVTRSSKFLTVSAPPSELFRPLRLQRHALFLCSYGMRRCVDCRDYQLKQRGTSARGFRMYTYAINFATATRHGLSDQQRVNAKTYIAWRWLPLRDPTRTTPHRVTPAPPRPAARTTASLVSASTARSGSRVRADVMTALKGSVARRARQRLRPACTKCGHRSCQQADD